MFHKTIILITAAIYFLTPYLIMNINVRCQCGCQEFICSCCRSPERSGDVLSLSECRCNIIEESYAQSPGAIEYPGEMRFPLDQIAQVICLYEGSILLGHQKPPMKPPPPP